MSIWQPSVERPDRDFDGKGDGERPESNRLAVLYGHAEERSASVQRIPTLIKGNQVVSAEESRTIESQATVRAIAHGIDHELE